MVEVIQIIAALTTNVNNPRVKIVTGKVRIVIIGRMTAFKRPSTSAAIRAV
jgi:hypothetical protein